MAVPSIFGNKSHHTQSHCNRSSPWRGAGSMTSSRLCKYGYFRLFTLGLVAVLFSATYLCFKGVISGGFLEGMEGRRKGDLSRETSLPSVIPSPVQMVMDSSGTFVLNHETVILYLKEDEKAAKEALNLATSLREFTRLEMRVQILTDARQKSPPNSIIVKLQDGKADLGEEGYEMEITSRHVVISAPKRAGIFYATQTILMLLPTLRYDKNTTWYIPCGVVWDKPRFSWRGVLLDVARHFFDVSTIKRIIDVMSLHKLNRLHLHLTDDQGWRFEVKKYPELTRRGAYRPETNGDHTPHWGFLTQDDCREIVRYAAERNVVVIPEIDMPGHATAALAAYPQFGNFPDRKIEVSTRWGILKSTFSVTEATFGFLEDILGELIEVFPSPYVHLGGDECLKNEWQGSAAAQAKMKEVGVENFEELQAYFMNRMAGFLKRRNRTIIGWDEIMEGGAPQGSIISAWRGHEFGVGAANKGLPVIITPKQKLYFDYPQADISKYDEFRSPPKKQITTLQDVYEFEPIHKNIEIANIQNVLGVQGSLWSEYIPTRRHLEYMAYPRLFALAEIAWSPKARRDYSDFIRRLDRHYDRLDVVGVNYRRHDKPPRY